MGQLLLPTWRALAAVLLVTACAACDVQDDSATTPATVSHSSSRPQVHLHASLVQQRTDEGTHRIDVRLTNRGTESIRVEKVHITWNAITGAATSIADADYEPGRIIDLKTDFGTTKCDVDPSTDVRVDVFLGDGTTVSLPVDRAGSAVLRRLFHRDCALRAIAAIAHIELAPQFREAKARERLFGSVEVTRTAESRGGDRRALQIDEISGSILFELTYAGDGKLPVRLRPHDAVKSIPVALAVANRCDAHALAESRATFVFSVYVRIGSGASQRVTLTPSPTVERQASSMIARVCD